MSAPFAPVKVTIAGEEFICRTSEQFMDVMHKVTGPLLEQLAATTETDPEEQQEEEETK